MEKMKSLSQILLALFVCRLLVTGASIGDALALAALSAVYGLYLHLEYKREPEVNTEIKEKISQLEEKVNKQENKLGAIALRR